MEKMKLIKYILLLAVCFVGMLIIFYFSDLIVEIMGKEEPLFKALIYLSLLIINMKAFFGVCTVWLFGHQLINEM